MSAELDQYLQKQPMFQFRLVDGSTIIGKILDIDDSNIVHLEEAYEVHFDPKDGYDTMEICLHKWMSMSELNIRAKNFYSKAVLKTKVEALSDDLTRREPGSIFSDVVRSIIEGLDNQDSLKDYSDWGEGFNSDRWKI